MSKLMTGVLLLGALGCGPKNLCPEPRYEGTASDEVWQSLQDALGRTQVDASSAPVLVQPGSSEALDPSGPAPQLVWTSPLSASAPRLRSGPGKSRPARPESRTLWARLGELVLPSAHAHLPPVTDDVYLVSIPLPGQRCDVQLLTTQLSWQLDAASWAKVVDSGAAELQIDLLGTYVRDNLVTEGPYRHPQPWTVAVSRP